MCFKNMSLEYLMTPSALWFLCLNEDGFEPPLTKHETGKFRSSMFFLNEENYMWMAKYSVNNCCSIYHHVYPWGSCQDYVKHLL